MALGSEPSLKGMLKRIWPVMLGLSVTMFVLRAAHGLQLGWALGGSGDLAERWVEYGYFINGVYPDPQLAGERALANMRTSVYPPYAFPMLWFFFGFGGWLQGRLIIALTTAASVPLLCWFSYRQLRRCGREAALVAALLPLLLASVVGVLEWGQFGFLCSGLVALQITAQENNRPYLAGIAWALAMLKPQIALPFAILFGFRQQWRGLLLGSGILLLLSLLATGQTEVHLFGLIDHWLSRQNLDFSFGNIAGIPLNIQRLIPGLTPAWILRIAAITAAILLVSVMGRCLQQGTQRNLLLFSGFCAVAGRLALYHRYHDDVMLLPALLAALAVAWQRRRSTDWLMFLATLATLVQPNSWQLAWPRLALVQSLIWMILGIHLLKVLMQTNGGADQLSGASPDEDAASTPP